jgi:PqqD family protein of HPr-rel-A system
MPRDWRALRPRDLLVERLEDGNACVFDLLSGETHVLSLVPADLLEQLAGESASDGALEQRIAQNYDSEPSAELQAQVRASLTQLEALGLIEHVGS